MTTKIILFIFAILPSISNATKPNYCEPSNSSCWPSPTEINTLSQSLNGQLLLPSDGIYTFYVNMTRDTLYTAYPSFIAVCLSAQDIQQCVQFASSHNIQISICSTGHSYSGRNVANNSIQINLSNMTKYKLNLSPKSDTITVETGLQWGAIYEIVNNANRIIVGGSDPGVGPGGYSMGGGHSILSPHYGLSSDFTTEYYIVDAQTNIIHVYNTSGINQTIDDLFWSLRGGGGSTFGVVINITFELHTPIQPMADNPITAVFCVYDFYEQPIKKQNFIGDIILKNVFELIRSNQIDSHWGGYIVNVGDAFLFDWFYYGNATYAKQNAQPLLMLNNRSNNNCEFVTYATFYDIEKRSGNSSAPGGNQYVFNALVPKNNLTNEYAELVNELLNHTTEGWTVGLTAVLQGGAVNERSHDYTSVTPAFRENYFEWCMGAFWGDSDNETIYNNAMDIVHEYEPKLRSYGLGIYSNEENADCIDCDWKYEFWGDHYDKLLSVKQKWDPNLVFWCKHCVGDE
eukprot:145096_1